MAEDSLEQRWFSNALVNVFGGMGTAGLNILLPGVVARYLSADAFSVWSLALQIIVYVNLLGLGLQTATARAIAYTTDAGEGTTADRPLIVRAARSISHIGAGLAILVVVALVLAYPLLFPNVPARFREEFRVVLALFGVTAVLQILAQADMGVFQGLHRYVAFVGPQTATRALAVLLVWIGVQTHQPIDILALLMAGALALLWPTVRTALVKWVPWVRKAGSAALDKARRRDLVKYCAALSVMSVSMLVVNSAGLLVVGRLDFHMTGAYAIAMTAATVPVGMLGAALTPLVTAAAAMYARPPTRLRIPALVMHSTVVVSVGLNLFFAGVVVLHAEILRLWVGEAFVGTTSALMVILVGAHCLRNIAAPYSVLLIAAGLHTRALYTAVFEGMINLVASIMLGIYYGALGVAMGTLIGSVVGVVGAFLFNTTRTPELTPHSIAFVMKAVLLPLLLLAPLQAYVLWAFM